MPYNEDIVLVSKSCFLPGSKNFSEFERNLLSEKCFVQELSNSRWDKKINFSPYKEVDDKSYSHFGAEITEEVYQETAQKWQIKSQNKLEIMATEAMSQAISGINLPQDKNKVGLILGAMNPDENFYITRFKKQLTPLLHQLEEKYSKNEFEIIRTYLDEHCRYLFKNIEENLDDILPQSVLSKIAKRFEISGPHFIVDAACAAAIASFDAAISLIRNEVIEFAFVGGIESNLGQGSYVLFSKVGALSPTQTLPFDKNSQGLSQGEGAVIFGIQRRSEAIRLGNPIIATILKVGSSSDGRVASLFQPDKEGQKLALQRAYENLSTRNIDYLEMHGTGTQIGDSTEASSANEFFENFHIPAGSIKYNIGHTKATAGAASLLKCLVIADHQIIPSSQYCQNPIFNKFDSLFLNRNQIQLHDCDSLRFGISSFGFGGTNFHLVMEVHQNKNNNQAHKYLSNKENSKAQSRVVIIGQNTLELKDLNLELFTGRQPIYKIPPLSIPYIDRFQLLAVLSVGELLQKMKLNLNQELKDQVQVISASSLGLDILDEIVARVSLDTIGETIRLENKYPELADHIFNLKNQFQKVSEESGPGILNNVIAGRVSNAFHFRGRNMNVDCDQGSLGAAMLVAHAAISNNETPLVIVIGIEESIHPQLIKVERKSVTVYLLSSLEFAQNQFLEIQQELKVNYESF